MDWTDLGSVKHQTEAEVKDAFHVCVKATKVYDTRLASIAVDNAAKGVAAEVTTKFKMLGETVLVLRDPSHCIDLLSKDLATMKFVRDVMADAKIVVDFVTSDRIDSIWLELIRDIVIDNDGSAQDMTKTRM